MDIRVSGGNGSLLGAWTALSGRDPVGFSGCIDAAMLAAAAGKLKIAFSVPICDIQGYWTPDLDRPRMQLDWQIRFRCAAHRGFPFLVFLNQAQENRGAFFLDNVVDDVIVIAAMNQQASTYEVSFEIAVLPETPAFRFHADGQAGPWTRTCRAFRETCATGPVPAFPDAAWLPVYCTWYARHAELDIGFLETNARLAADIGCGTFIVDDGWCFDEMKRVTPQTLGSWYDTIGDWVLSANKLPGFLEHVVRAQQLGLKYLLWVAPFFAGVHSRLHRQLEGPDRFLTPVQEGCRVFDPIHTDAAAGSRNRLVALMREYGLDGLKIDFVDAVPQDPDRPRGRVVLAYMRALCGALRQVKADALIEFRQRYATPQMLPLATQFRAGDAPFDYLDNLHRVAQVRVILGDRVPVHADPVYWHPGESSVNVARHMIASLAGVPMVSMDLALLPAPHLSIVRHYLAFYRDHLETFRTGAWTIDYHFDHLAYAAVENGRERIVILLDPAARARATAGCAGALHVLNLTPEPVDWPGPGIRVDGSGERLDDARIPCGGRGAVAGSSTL